MLHYLVDDLYIRPWARILPYFIGIAGGWFYNEYKDYKYSNVTTTLTKVMAKQKYWTNNFSYFIYRKQLEYYGLYQLLQQFHHTLVLLIEIYLILSVHFQWHFVVVSMHWQFVGLLLQPLIIQMDGLTNWWVFQCSNNLKIWVIHFIFWIRW